MRRTLIALLAVTAALTVAAPAHAIPPETTTFEGNNFDNPDVYEDACGEGVDLIEVYEESGSETVFFDKDENPTRLQIHVVYNGLLTRSDTGNSVADPGRVNAIVDLVTGDVTFNGLAFNVIDPGDGPVFQVIGRRVFVEDVFGPVFVAGPSDRFDGKDFFEEVCNATA